MPRTNEDREFIREWIRIYRSLPALWDVKSHEYNNRREKNIGYQVLVDKFKERYPDATREDVTKKINSLRTNYRKELKRINDLIQCGYENAESNLWYFDEMNFLAQAQDIIHLPAPSQNSNQDSQNIEEEVSDEYFSYEIPEVESVYLVPEKEETPKQAQPPVKKRKKDIKGYLKFSESEYEQVAKTWAMELQKMSPEQQLHAKKAINEILYEGQLGNLYRNCVQVHPPSMSCNSTPNHPTTSAMSPTEENSQH